MTCKACGLEAPEGMRFCGGCGAKLPRACSGCGFANPDGFAFCGQCGQSLADEPAAAAPPPEAPVRSEPAPEPEKPAEDVAERRLVTVMFCDLVGSTALSEQLDPEELRDVVRRYHGFANPIIERYSGHVAQYLGDGLLVYFGFPRAQENDAQRAVLSALEICGRVGELNAELVTEHGVEIAVRIGIHTGLVVAGDVGAGARTERLAMGRTPNVAARLEGLAEPNTVVISSATHELVRGFFECESMGKKELKGVAGPMEVLRAVRETGVRDRFEVTEASGLSDFVGRKDDLAVLLNAFHSAKSGSGQVVIVSGEAGIGKSRLQDALKQRTKSQVDTWLTCRCSAYHENSALNPVIELLQRMLGFGREDDGEAKRRKLAAAIRRLGQPQDETLPLLASLLSLPGAEEIAQLGLSPQRQRERTAEILLDVIFRLAARGPVVFCVEDLHWVDPSTLELLGRLLEQAPSHRLLVLLSHRPSFESPWADGGHVRSVRLERLTERQGRALIDSVSRQPLPPEVVREIIKRTDGVPLFVEELTKMLLGSGLLQETDRGYELAGQLPAHAIPHTLQDSLTARLDRLEEGKDVAQLAAVLGRRFSHALIREVASLDAQVLQRRLSAVVDAELLVEVGEAPDSFYYFRHALIQDAAHESLLKRRRRDLHARVAHVLEEKFPDVASTEPEVLARHFEEAGDERHAVRYLGLAGRQAVGRWAHAEAIRHFERGLHHLASLPECPERHQSELGLCMPLGVSFINTRGYTAPEVERTFSRARELCHELGETPFQVQYGIWAVHVMRGDRKATDELVAWFEDYIEKSDVPADTRLMAHACIATHAFYRGDPPDAKEHAAKAMELFEPDDHEAMARQYGGSGGLYGHIFMTWLHCLTGEIRQAEANQERLLELVETLRDPFPIAEVLTISMTMRHACGDAQAVEELAERVVRIASEQHFVSIQAISTCGLGWAKAERGRVEEGLTLIRTGLAILKAAGMAVLHRYYTSLQLEAYLLAGMREEGLALVTEQLAHGEDCIDSFWEPELRRLEGELRLLEPREEEWAESCFLRALSQAQQQGARLLELRAATSLARLLAHRGRAEEASSILLPIHSQLEHEEGVRSVKQAAELLATLPRATA